MLALTITAAVCSFLVLVIIAAIEESKCNQTIEQRLISYTKKPEAWEQQKIEEETRQSRARLPGTPQRSSPVLFDPTTYKHLRASCGTRP